MFICVCMYIFGRFVESVMRTLNPVKQDSIPNFDPLGDLYRIPLRPPPRDSRDRRTLLAASDATPSISSNIRLVNVSIVEKYLYYFWLLLVFLVLKLKKPLFLKKLCLKLYFQRMENKLLSKKF